MQAQRNLKKFDIANDIEESSLDFISLITGNLPHGRSAVGDLDHVAVGVQEEDLAEGGRSRHREVLVEEDRQSLERLLDGIEVAARESHVVASGQGGLNLSHLFSQRQPAFARIPRRDDVQVESVAEEPEALGLEGGTGHDPEPE